MRERLAVALVGVGLVQMTGDLLGLPALKGIGMATAASPAPRVFTSIRGYEPYSTRFFLEWRNRDGTEHSVLLTPARYAHLKGAYNRRNAYGAALAGGPVLSTDARTSRMLRDVLAYALCEDAPLLRELGLEADDLDGPPWLRYEPRTGLSPTALPLRLRPSCRA